MTVYVLVADDETDLRETLRMLLEGEGYIVSEAADGQQALDAIRASAASMVVLLDVLMPLRSGVEVLSDVMVDPALAARHAYLLFTADSRTAVDMAAGLFAGMAVTLVKKPFDIDDLLREVASAAARLPK
jgi:CheY-like chemotaxis protein